MQIEDKYQTRLPKEYGRVGVIMGGCEAEREISLSSGMTIMHALEQQDINAVKIEANAASFHEQLQSIDRAFIAMHGELGEGGPLQAMLDWYQIPYTGSDYQSSVLAMNKCLTKQLWLQAGLPTPDFIPLLSKKDLKHKFFQLNKEVAIKPARDGSTFGITKVTQTNDLLSAYNEALEFDNLVFAESWVRGAEYTVAILNNKALPSIKIEPKEEFYNFIAKYQESGTEYSCPSGLSAAKEAEIQTLALNAFNVLGCKVWGRVDFILDEYNQFWLLELNTVPGMTPISLYPKAALQKGMSYNELVDKILMPTLYG